MNDKWLIGADEVGTGALAGPLVTCAVAVPLGWRAPAGLNDSKQLSKTARHELYVVLEKLDFQLMMVTSKDIDSKGMGFALNAAHVAAIKVMMSRYPGAAVIRDGDAPISIPGVRCIPKADGIYPAVMAASVIAKVNRDYVMRQYHMQYPEYRFDRNVGYGGGKDHTSGLKNYGVTPIHRRSFAPIKKLLREGAWTWQPDPRRKSI